MPWRVLSPTLKTGGCEGHRILSSHRYAPQKERREDVGKRRNASNRPVRIPAELRSRNRNLEINLLLSVDRSRRLSDGGWSEARTSSRRRNSRSHGN